MTHGDGNLMCRKNATGTFGWGQSIHRGGGNCPLPWPNVATCLYITLTTNIIVIRKSNFLVYVLHTDVPQQRFTAPERRLRKPLLCRGRLQRRPDRAPSARWRSRYFRRLCRYCFRLPWSRDPVLPPKPARFTTNPLNPEWGEWQWQRKVVHIRAMHNHKSTLSVLTVTVTNYLILGSCKRSHRAYSLSSSLHLHIVCIIMMRLWAN